MVLPGLVEGDVVAVVEGGKSRDDGEQLVRGQEDRGLVDPGLRERLHLNLGPGVRGEIECDRFAHALEREEDLRAGPPPRPGHQAPEEVGLENAHQFARNGRALRGPGGDVPGSRRLR